MVKKDVAKNEKPWPDNNHVLHLARRANCCTVLGPRKQSVLWFQGCPFRCPGCIAPETQRFRGGQDVDVDLLAEELKPASAFPVPALPAPDSTGQ
ncbi:MAG: 4Fe-4S cluster-binding domain-containing protein [Planctomycetota bacterium]